MTMVSKRQNLKDKLSLQTQTLNFDFREDGDIDRIPDAYERLFLDAVNGDPSLFVGRDEIEESWRWCDGLISACEQVGVAVNGYQAGSWGPSKSDLLIERDGRSWSGGIIHIVGDKKKAVFERARRCDDETRYPITAFLGSIGFDCWWAP